jgi:hypothetical protein
MATFTYLNNCCTSVYLSATKRSDPRGNPVWPLIIFIVSVSAFPVAPIIIATLVWGLNKNFAD